MIALDELNKRLENSDSYSKCVKSKSEMAGSTFHLHYFILQDLADILNKPIRYLEIGIFNGGSLSLMLKHRLTKVAIGIDPLWLPYQAVLTEANVSKFKKPDQDVHIFKKLSTEPGLPAEIKDIVGEVDILFIDGAHDRNSVISDFEHYYPLVAVSGFIVFDDYHDFKHSPEVHGAVNEIVERIKRGDYGAQSFNIIGAPTNYVAERINVPLLNEFIIQIL
jgi:cephalosporin hydroxylase